MRLWQFTFSTNAERVGLALAFKGLEAEPVAIDPGDRSDVVALSGQPLVPVLEHDGQVISGSLHIVAYLEERFPEPSLWPDDPARHAEADLFCDWFDLIWKGPPNRIADGEAHAGDADALTGSLERFESLLTGRDFLLGDEFTIADVAAFPFLRYAVHCHDSDREPFHQVLVEHLALKPRHRCLRMWIERVDRFPRSGLLADWPLAARFGH